MLPDPLSVQLLPALLAGVAKQEGSSISPSEYQHMHEIQPGIHFWAGNSRSGLPLARNSHLVAPFNISYPFLLQLLNGLVLCAWRAV